jgi:hypothetical protein
MSATAPGPNSDVLIMVLGIGAIYLMTRKTTTKAPLTSVANPNAGGVRPGVTPTTPSTAVNILGQAINRLLYPVSMGSKPTVNPGEYSYPSFDFGQSVVDSGLTDKWGSLGFDIAAPDDSGVPLLSGTQTSDAFNFMPDISFGQ